MSKARYAVGIDLGTTHCVISCLDLELSDLDDIVQEVVDIPQLTAPGSVEERPVLPSFIYLPHPDELDPNVLDTVHLAGQRFERVLKRLAGSKR